MSLFDGIVALGVVLGFGYLIFVRLLHTNPKAAETIRNILPTKLYERIENDPISDKIQQVYQEKRTMM